MLRHGFDRLNRQLSTGFTNLRGLFKICENP